MLPRKMQVGKHGRHRSWKQKTPYPRTRQTSLSNSLLTIIIVLIVLMFKYPWLLFFIGFGGFIFYVYKKESK